MKPNYGWRVGLAAVVVITAGCGVNADRTAAPAAMKMASQDYDESGRTKARANYAGAMQPTLGYPGAMPPGNPSTAPEPANNTLAGMADQMPDRYLIKTAIMSVETGDVRRAADALIAAARAAQGYVSDSHESVDSLGGRSIILQVRVPADKFDGSLAQAEKLGKVLDKQVTAQDVTEEFVDSQSRLRNLRHTEDRLLAHLSRTGKLSDTLLVEKELTRVRQEIEQLDGRIRFLNHRIGFSTLNITIKETARAQAMVPPESYSSGKVASEASRSLVGFAQSLWSVTIWLAVWAIVWIPLLVMAGWLFRRLRTVGA